jgi:uncharacterized protein (TIGR00369 family)
MPVNDLKLQNMIDGAIIMQGFGPTSIEKIKAWSGLEFLLKIQNDELPQPTIHRALDFRLHEIGPGHAVFTGVPSEDYLNPMGTVHGGYISALLDSAMACSAHSLCPEGFANTTIEMKINFVSPVTASNCRLLAYGRVVKPGRTITTTQGKLIDEEGKLYAHGTQTCMRVKIK